jgi:hypothetical protein
MTIKMETAVDALRAGPLADPTSRMKPHGRDIVVAEIDSWKARGLRAHVLVTPHNDSIDVATLWKRLDYDLAKDLLIVFDGYAFRGRGWGHEEISGHGPEKTTRTIADELITLLRARGALVASSPSPAPKALPRPPAPGQSAPPSPSPATSTSTSSDTGGGFPVLPVVGGTLAVAAGGLVALAIVRRNKLAREGGVKLADAKASVERACAELILACEELPGDPQATEIQLKAAELKKRMDAIVDGTAAKPAGGNDPLTLGQLRQLENEIAALRSTVLQKERK